MKQLVGICVVVILCICTISEANTHKDLSRRGSISRQEKRDNCPNYCSGHGICNADGSCTCDIGFIGTDCSLEITPLNGTAVSGGVLMFGWSYYSLPVAYSGRSIQVNLTQTSSGDCDLYIRAAALPSRNAYDARDISTKTSFVLTVPSAQVGTYYIGVYGFQSCDYTMLALVTNGCPNSCSGHGTCLNGQCLCNNGYGGSDCSSTLNDLVIGTPVSGNVAAGEMKNYRLHIVSGNAVNVSLAQTSSTGDCDLYIKYNQEPSIWSWDYANVTLHNHSIIFIEDVRQGYYYIGVYGFDSCSYNLLVTTETICPNKCSYRGTCSSDNLGCQCNQGYNGDYCQNKTTSIVDGNVINGYVENHLWNYYTFESNSDDNMILTVDQHNEGSDCDLFVKANGVPTSFNYDYKETGTSNHFTLTVEDPGRTWWTIGVYGWAVCNYTLTVGESSDCPSGCSGHGTCAANGECICDAGYSGEACDSASSHLDNGVAISGHSVTVNQWSFFTFTITNSTTAHIQVKELTTSGYLYVFVAKTTPTIRSFLYSDISITNIHRIDIGLQQPVTDTYIIGVYGNPFSFGQSIQFSIVAWSAPNF